MDLPRDPSVSGTKVVTQTGAVAGDVVRFTIAATNDGTVTLGAVAVEADVLTRADGTVLALSSGPDFASASGGSPEGTLVPGETATWTATYALTQADVDAGGIANAATVGGTGPSGVRVTDDASDDGAGTPASVGIDPAPALGLVKRPGAGAPLAVSAVDEALPYEFVVTNRGNVTIASVSIDDVLIDGVDCPDLAKGLRPGETATCTATYRVTQADLDRGEIVNVATASGGGVSSPPSTVTVPALQRPAATVSKTAEPLAAADFVVGAEVSYAYVVENTGNVTLTEPVTVADDRIAAVDCPALPAGGLAPGAALTCAATYTVTAADVDLGVVTNVASAASGGTTSPPVTETVPDAGVPALSVSKTAEAGAAFAAPGDAVAYDFAVTNAGTRAFVRPVTVEDDRIGTVACWAPTAADPDLRPGETVTCRATDVATQADLDRGEIVNVAFAATAIGGAEGDVPVSSDVATETVAADLAPSLDLGVAVAGGPVAGAGDVLTYTLTATNDGNQTLYGVRVTDPALPGLVCAAAVLAPGETLTCTEDHAVTQAEFDAGLVETTATAVGEAPDGTPVDDTADAAVPALPTAPRLVLEKTGTPAPFGPVGSDLTFVLTATNAGDVTLRDVAVTDPMAPAGFSCAVALLAPGASETCTFAVPVTQADVDRGAVVNTAAATATPLRGDAVEASATLTVAGPERAPALELTKTVSGVGLAAGDRAAFLFRVENTGNVTLEGVALADAMTRLDGTPVALDAAPAFVSGDDGNGRLDVGETWLYAAQRTLTQADVDAGGLRNQATATATGPSGTEASDLSDDGDDADGDATSDPTDARVAAAPALDAVKTVTATGAAAGETVAFRITATNVGNVVLTDLTVEDALTRADGTAIAATVSAVDVPATLAPGETATWEAVRVLTQADVDAGGLRNVAVVGGTAPDGSATSDVADDGDDTDGDTSGDPTEAPIVGAPGLEVVKRVVSTGAAAGDAAIFEIAVRNTGNVSVTGLAVADRTTALDGSDPRAPAAVFVSADGGSPEGTLAPGETATYSVSVTLTQGDVDGGGVLNQATASGTGPSGAPVSDLSDIDGTEAGRPTPAPIAPAPALSVVKRTVSTEALFPTVMRTTFRIEVTNTGNVTQTGLRVADDLVTFAAPGTLLSAVYPPVVSHAGFGPTAAANPLFDGAGTITMLVGDGTLAPGETGVVTVTATHTMAPGAAPLENVAFATSAELGDAVQGAADVAALDADGDGVPDGTESTTLDRDDDGVPDAQDYDPTGYFYCEEDGRILSGGRITVRGGGASQTGVGTTGPITVVEDGSTGFFQFFATAAGTYTLELTYPPVGDPSTARVSGGTVDVTTLLPANPASLGSNEFGATGVLADFSAGANPFFTAFEVEAGDPYVVNNNIPVRNCGGVRDVAATKVADRDSAVLGETVGYTLTYRNDTLLDFAAVAVDRLPAGLIYEPGSAVVQGAAQEPVVAATELRWPLTVAAGSTATITFRARVTSAAGYGPKVNETVLLTPTGRALSNRATATVRIEPEAVFACSDVIGKVFDDRNMDGHHSDEPGIPHARIVAPDGLIIRTDEHGRFSVPCAALPEREGSNFALKLDPSSLPSGYRVTTENPRVIRLTPGKMARLNFGVTLARVVDIDLTAAAFTAGGQPRRELGDALASLRRRIGDDPSLLRLTYVTRGGESRAGARDRLRAVERLVRERWPGRRRPDIEKTVREGR